MPKETAAKAADPRKNPLEDATLTQQVVAAINQLYLRTDELYHEVATKAGLTDSAFEILYCLMHYDGLTQKELCTFSCALKQTVNSSIKRLQADGLVEFHGSGRGSTVHLTRAGRKAVREKVRPIYEAECAAVDVFGPGQQRRLIKDVERYTASLAERFGALEF